MDELDIRQLCEIYDRGRLVPFTGAGLSMGAAVGWRTFVCRLAGCAEVIPPPDDSAPNALVDVADRAMTALRCRSPVEAIRKHLENAVYTERCVSTPQTDALVKLEWPLVCTTNYDDVYLAAKITLLRELEKKASAHGSRRLSRPEVVGRSDRDCRRVLAQLQFPVGEVLWALQGLLPPRGALQAELDDTSGPESEIVVGHAEYSRATHREPWFRRAFAEVFRSSSFLFLGSGLSDPYFLALFDEIMDLMGPPNRPHFAVVPETTDADRLWRRYHISCETYAEDQHCHVVSFLQKFESEARNRRARESAWSFCVSSPRRVDNTKIQGDEDFAVVRAGLPYPCQLPEGEVLAISCGGTVEKPLVGPRNVRQFGLQRFVACGPVVCFPRGGKRPVYGIVAREQGEEGEVRTPAAVQTELHRALVHFSSQGVEKLHLQLLAAGPERAFHPWISLVQMARAFGEWFRQPAELHGRPCVRSPLKLRVYVVDPTVTLLLRGGYLNLVECLDGTDLYVRIRIVPKSGPVVEHFRYAKPEGCIGDLIRHDLPKCDPKDVPIDLEPALQKKHPTRHTTTLADVQTMTTQELGLVSGSVLALSYG